VLSLLPSIVLFHPTRVVQKMFFQSLAYCIKSRSQVNRLVRCLEYSCLPDDDFGLHLPLSCITLQPPLMAILVEANVRDAEKIHTTALRRSNCAKKRPVKGRNGRIQDLVFVIGRWFMRAVDGPRLHVYDAGFCYSMERLAPALVNAAYSAYYQPT